MPPQATAQGNRDEERKRRGRQAPGARFTEMVLGALDEAAAVPREDAGHGGLPLAGDLVVGVGLLNREARRVHVSPHHDLPYPLRYLRLQLLGQRLRSRRCGLFGEPPLP